MIQLFTAKRKLQTLIFFLFISMPLICNADIDVTLQWDPSDQAIEGYQLFGREEGQDYDYDAFWWQGDHTFNQCTIEGLDENKTYYFVLRAFSGDNVSADSNEVRYETNDLATNDLAPNDLAPNDSYLDDGGGGSDDLGGSGGSSSGCFVQTIF